MYVPEGHHPSRSNWHHLTTTWSAAGLW